MTDELRCLACDHRETDHDPTLGLCTIPGCGCGQYLEPEGDEVAPLDFEHPDAQ